jgi:hypothetical protein
MQSLLFKESNNFSTPHPQLLMVVYFIPLRIKLDILPKTIENRLNNPLKRF